jgi:hypothetical protein
MAFYAYCLLRLNPEESWPVIEGISEHPVFPLRCGKYAMLLSRIDRQFPFSPRSIVEHGQVIAKAFESRTVLPMRFATFFKSEKEIQNLIQENQKELLEAFCRLRGKSEMRLKLLFPTDATDLKQAKKPCQKTIHLAETSASGPDVLLEEKNRELAHQLAARIGAMFHPLEQQISCRLIRSREMVVDCAHLVDSQKVEIYQRLLASASAQVKNCDLRISGPWPPYHFLPTSVRMPTTSSIPLRRRAAAGSR